MGKRANEKRKRLFAEIAEKDQRMKPPLKVKDRGKATKPFRYPTTQRNRVADLRCCIVKHDGDLPTYFVRCRDCPLDTGPET